MNAQAAISAVPELTLNEGQQAAADEFFHFLLSNHKELRITGPGGVGKTRLMGWMIDRVMPRYQEACRLMGLEPQFDEVEMTATTNKAAEQLADSTKRPTKTIHSFLNLKVKNDFKTGQTLLTKSKNFKVHENKIIFIDEYSMIDSNLFFMIHEGTENCKIVYVGDHCQLAPVMERVSPVDRQNMPTSMLTQPVRNADQPALMAVCQQARNTVETGNFLPIQEVPGVIDIMSDEDMKWEIENHFAQMSVDARILAYTNDRVIQYNDHIRSIRGLPDEPISGETLVNNNAITLSNTIISVDRELTLGRDHGSDIVELPQNGELKVKSFDLYASNGAKFEKVKVPLDRNHFRDLLKYYAQCKDWSTHFQLKEQFPDLRPREASTVYKAQGSTYDTVFIDLGNISTCNNPNQVARMLYVALSRARSRVILYGELADKYGGLLKV